MLDAQAEGAFLKTGSTKSLDTEEREGAVERTQQHQRNKSVKFGENSIAGIESSGADGEGYDGIAEDERKSSINDCMPEIVDGVVAGESGVEGEENGLNGVEFDDVEEDEEDDTSRQV